ncbi:GAF domain-containing sensor histidine kinase [Caballeronia sp. AZ7_KS35]|uniref:GAF domain-containing sensor histidine kinase n=1 Tax=Caballeronia sp. AZ7_KS35 TaxID=2921762 RepID=UPI0032EBD4A5
MGRTFGAKKKCSRRIIRPCHISAAFDMITLTGEDGPDALKDDIEAIGRVSAVGSMLKAICERTSMGYAAVARVTDNTWTACAVHDDIGFGLEVGGQLDLKTTLCFESREARESIVIDDFGNDPRYCGHHTARIYNLQSYISVPIVLSNGRYFGNLCAIDPRPRYLSDVRTVCMFEAYAKLIALELELEENRSASATALSHAREAAELREQFIAVLGHDLRNPLTAVHSIAEYLSIKGGTTEITQLGLRLKAVAGRMAGLIDDVMDFARGRLGAGLGAHIAPDPDLGKLLRDIVSEAKAGHPGLMIEDSIAIEGTVHCDSIRMQQLLSNLLGNAITHGAADLPITVNGKVEAGKLIIAVKNGGDAIAPEDIRKVFEPYWRPADKPRGGGLGLGLFICKQIVQAHNGDLQVSSSLADGTCFTAIIPVRQA